MNLTKLFNLKYLKENIKKSKGFIVLIMMLVPALTFLLTIVIGNESSITTVAEEPLILAINLIGMYVIPVLISFVLFGYVYKKISVDFINSQPINRKTIFITNTIGGIIIITLIQVITAIILLLCNLFLTKLIIFPEMIFDMFVLMWVSYVFVFTATNIAMTISGTHTTQIVLTMLILFLVPFTMDNFRNFSELGYAYKYKLVQDEEDLASFRYTENYTMPYQTLHLLSSNNWYNSETIKKMAILSILYIGIGIILFEKRKMEHNEESFANPKIHILVKALTMYPMVVLINLISEPGEAFWIFAIALISVYYFLYDFIVKRKIKFITSVICLVIILAVLQGTYALKDRNYDSRIVLRPENIAAIKINSFSRNTDYYSTDIINDYETYIENEEVLKIIFDSATKVSNTQKERIEKEKNGTYDFEYSSDINETRMNITIKTEKNKIMSGYIRIYTSDMKKIIDLLNKDEKFMSNLKKCFYEDGETIVERCGKLNSEDTEILLEEIENKVENINFKDAMEMNNVKNIWVKKIYYKNHKLITLNIQDNLTPKMLEVIAKNVNIKMLDKLDEMENIKNEKGFFPEMSIYVLTDNSNLCCSEVSKEIIDLIKNSKDIKFEADKPYYLIEGYYLGQSYFYMNKNDKIEELINYQKEFDNNLKILYDDEIVKDYEY